MSEWFWAGLWGGIGYAISGLAVMALIVAAAGLYVGIRIFLDWAKIKEWKP